MSLNNMNIIKEIVAIAQSAIVRCTICQEDVKNPMLLKCQHIFCNPCLKQFFDVSRGFTDKPTCPNCNVPVNKRASYSYPDIEHTPFHELILDLEIATGVDLVHNVKEYTLSTQSYSPSRYIIKKNENISLNSSTPIVSIKPSNKNRNKIENKKNKENRLIENKPDKSEVLPLRSQKQAPKKQSVNKNNKINTSKTNENVGAKVSTSKLPHTFLFKKKTIESKQKFDTSEEVDIKNNKEDKDITLDITIKNESQLSIADMNINHKNKINRYKNVKTYSNRYKQDKELVSLSQRDTSITFPGELVPPDILRTVKPTEPVEKVSEWLFDGKNNFDRLTLTLSTQVETNTQEKMVQCLPSILQIQELNCGVNFKSNISNRNVSSTVNDNVSLGVSKCSKKYRSTEEPKKIPKQENGQNSKSSLKITNTSNSDENCTVDNKNYCLESLQHTISEDNCNASKPKLDDVSKYNINVKKSNNVSNSKKSDLWNSYLKNASMHKRSTRISNDSNSSFELKSENNLNAKTKLKSENVNKEIGFQFQKQNETESILSGIQPLPSSSNFEESIEIQTLDVFDKLIMGSPIRKKRCSESDKKRFFDNTDVRYKSQSEKNRRHSFDSLTYEICLVEKERINHLLYDINTTEKCSSQNKETSSLDIGYKELDHFIKKDQIALLKNNSHIEEHLSQLNIEPKIDRSNRYFQKKLSEDWSRLKKSQLSRTEKTFKRLNVSIESTRRTQCFETKKVDAIESSSEKFVIDVVESLDKDQLALLEIDKKLCDKSENTLNAATKGKSISNKNFVEKPNVNLVVEESPLQTILKNSENDKFEKTIFEILENEVNKNDIIEDDSLEKANNYQAIKSKLNLKDTNESIEVINEKINNSKGEIKVAKQCEVIGIHNNIVKTNTEANNDKNKMRIRKIPGSVKINSGTAEQTPQVTREHFKTGEKNEGTMKKSTQVIENSLKKFNQENVKEHTNILPKPLSQRTFKFSMKKAKKSEIDEKLISNRNNDSELNIDSPISALEHNNLLLEKQNKISNIESNSSSTETEECLGFSLADLNSDRKRLKDLIKNLDSVISSNLQLKTVFNENNCNQKATKYSSDIELDYNAQPNMTKSLPDKFDDIYKPFNYSDSALSILRLMNLATERLSKDHFNAALIDEITKISQSLKKKLDVDVSKQTLVEKASQTNQSVKISCPKCCCNFDINMSYKFGIDKNMSQNNYSNNSDVWECETIILNQDKLSQVENLDRTTLISTQKLIETQENVNQNGDKASAFTEMEALEENAFDNDIFESDYLQFGNISPHSTVVLSKPLNESGLADLQKQSSSSQYHNDLNLEKFSPNTSNISIDKHQTSVLKKYSDKNNSNNLSSDKILNTQTSINKQINFESQNEAFVKKKNKRLRYSGSSSGSESEKSISKKSKTSSTTAESMKNIESFQLSGTSDANYEDYVMKVMTKIDQSLGEMPVKNTAESSIMMCNTEELLEKEFRNGRNAINKVLTKNDKINQNKPMEIDFGKSDSDEEGFESYMSDSEDIVETTPQKNQSWKKIIPRNTSTSQQCAQVVYGSDDNLSDVIPLSNTSSIDSETPYVLPTLPSTICASTTEHLNRKYTPPPDFQDNDSEDGKDNDSTFNECFDSANFDNDTDKTLVPEVKRNISVLPNADILKNMKTPTPNIDVYKLKNAPILVKSAEMGKYSPVRNSHDMFAEYETPKSSSNSSRNYSNAKLNDIDQNSNSKTLNYSPPNVKSTNRKLDIGFEVVLPEFQTKQTVVENSQQSYMVSPSKNTNEYFSGYATPKSAANTFIKDKESQNASLIESTPSFNSRNSKCNSTKMSLEKKNTNKSTSKSSIQLKKSSNTSESNFGPLVVIKTKTSSNVNTSTPLKSSRQKTMLSYVDANSEKNVSESKSVKENKLSYESNKNSSQASCTQVNPNENLNLSISSKLNIQNKEIKNQSKSNLQTDIDLCRSGPSGLCNQKSKNIEKNNEDSISLDNYKPDSLGSLNENCSGAEITRKFINPREINSQINDSPQGLKRKSSSKKTSLAKKLGSEGFDTSLCLPNSFTSQTFARTVKNAASVPIFTDQYTTPQSIQFETPNSQLFKQPVAFSTPKVTRNALDICVACSRLEDSKMILLKQFLIELEVRFQPNNSPDITHLIVETNSLNEITNFTMKYICAVANGCWVLSFDWIVKCLDKKELIDEEPFEALDASGVPGPRLSRLSDKSKKILSDFDICVVEPMTTSSLEVVQSMVISTGAKLFKNPDEMLTKVPGRIRLIITESMNVEEWHVMQYQAWYDKYGIVTVDLEWMTQSICQYRVQSFLSWILCQNITSLDEYPSYLTVETQDYDTEKTEFTD